jgi:hypothetical protein
VILAYLYFKHQQSATPGSTGGGGSGAGAGGGAGGGGGHYSFKEWLVQHQGGGHTRDEDPGKDRKHPPKPGHRR